MTPAEPAPTVRDVSREFAGIVRSHPEVRAAYASHGPARVWWRAILALHGEPVRLELSPERQRLVVARGFEVYAWIFRGLAVLLVLALLGLALLPGAIDSDAFSLALAGAGPAALELWIASGLLLTGARAHRAGRGDAAAYLVLGLLMAMLFLCVALTAASVALQRLAVVPLWLNVGALLGLLVLGVGSYMLELNYVLVTRPASVRPPDAG